MWSEMAHGKVLQEEIEGRRTSEMRILSSLALDNEPLAGFFGTRYNYSHLVGFCLRQTSLTLSSLKEFSKE